MLLGHAVRPPVTFPIDKPLAERLDDAQLTDLSRPEPRAADEPNVEEMFAATEFLERSCHLLAAEGVRAVLIPSGNIGPRDDCGGDCRPFMDAGIPTPSFKQDPLEYETRTHHTNMDTYERLVEEDLQQAAIVLATMVYNTAMRNDLLPRGR